MKRKAIVTVAEGPHAPMLDLALPTFEHYAARFDYEVVVASGEQAAAAGRPGPWRKIPALQDALERYDLVLWLDTDVMILDPSKDIAGELHDGDYQGLVEQVSHDGRIPNTGVWILRSDDRARRFLHETWNQEQLIDHMWTDQAAAVTVLGYDLAPWLPDASLSRPCERRRDSDLFAGTRLLPSDWNSLFFWLPAEHPRFNHHAGGWPLERRLQAMRDDAARLPWHPLSSRHGPPEHPDDAPLTETDRRYALIDRRLASILRPGDEFAVSDGEEWRPTSRLSERGVPFPHREGTWIGWPADDQTAIEEIERERARGSRVLAFVWPSMWWLDAYPEASRHLRRRFECLTDDETLVAFDLHQELADRKTGCDEPFRGMRDPDRDGAIMEPPAGRLAEVLAEVAASRPKHVVQLGLHSWSLSACLGHAWPYVTLWGFGGDFQIRERCRRLACANRAAVERVVLQEKCEPSWLAAMALKDPVIIAAAGNVRGLLEGEPEPDLSRCRLLLQLDDTSVQGEVLRRFDSTHRTECFEADRSGLCAWLLPLDRGVYEGPATEDLLERLSAEQPIVRFLHIGAHDGVSDERLECFIRERGWRGVFVEPVPALFSALRQHYAGFEGLAFENSAVAETTGDRLFFEVLPRPDMPAWVVQLSSLRKDVILAHASSVPGLEDCIVERRVPCLPVSTLLAKHAIDRVDVVVIDTEGYDFEILRQFDLDELRPKVVIYEEKHLTDRDVHRARTLLDQAGYEVRQSGSNDCLAVRESWT